MMTRWGDINKWEWPPFATAMEETGLWKMWNYVRRRQATILEYITGRPIFELCTRAERREEYIRFPRFWYQDHGKAGEGVE